MTDARTRLSIDEYARTTALLRAHAEHGAVPGAETAVLASLRLDAEAWDGVCRHWNESIESEVRRGRHDMAIAFTRAFRAERERIEREGLPSGGLAPPPPASNGASAPVVPAPSRQPHRSEAPTPSPGVDETSTEFRALGPSLPLAFLDAAAPSPGFLAAVKGGEARDVTPCADVGMTTAVRVSDLDLGRPPTPFAPNIIARAATSSTQGSGTESAEGARPSQIDETSTDFRALGPELPFGAEEPVPDVPGVGANTSASVTRGAPVSTVSKTHGPVAGPREPVVATSAPSGATSSASRAPATASLTLEQYASLCAELAAAPAHKQQVLARYRVPDATALQALDASWGQRFASAPDERARFDALVRDYLNHLRTYGSGRHGSGR